MDDSSKSARMGEWPLAIENINRTNFVQSVQGCVRPIVASQAMLE